jgi:hypothetical protein
VAEETASGKGRATPSRKEAELARKKNMKTPKSRKEQVKRERAAREAARAKQRDALKNGDERFLPARDRGPIRRFVRDYVDRRFNVAEFLLPFLVLLLVAYMFAGGSQSTFALVLTTYVYPAVIIATLIDEIFMVRGLKRELAARFAGENLKGTTTYAVLRSTQLRRFRLPKPAVARREPLGNSYR